MSAHIVSPKFANASVLATLNIRCYTARKEDKKISRKVAADNDTTTDAGGYQKNLVPKQYLEPITKAVSALRDFHYRNTMQWLDEGVRILPAMNYEKYKTEFEKLRDGYDIAVRDFCACWPKIVADAEQALGKMFNPADYPSDIRSRFGVTLRFMPVADAEAFQMPINDDELAALRQQISGSLDVAKQQAMGELYTRLSDGVKAMAERLRAYTVDPVTGKTSSPFRDSLVENLRELVALIPRLNFMDDPELEAIRAMVESDLCAADAETLRADDATREQVAESAEALAARLGEFMQ